MGSSHTYPPPLVQATESQGKLSMDAFSCSFSQTGSCLGTKNKEFLSLVLLVTLLLTPWKREGRSCLSQMEKKTNARPG